MKTFIALGAAALLAAGAARADDSDVRHDALAAHADAPSTPPTLPDQASARAKTVQSTIAHGKKGAEERAAHAGEKAAEDAQGDANRSAQGAAASAAKSANADSHAAAGQARAEQARGGKVPGKKPGGHGR